MSESLTINGYQFTVGEDGIKPVETAGIGQAYVVTLTITKDRLDRWYAGHEFYIHMTQDYVFNASLAFPKPIYHAKDIDDWVLTSIAFAALQRSGLFSIQISKPNYNGLRCLVRDESTIVEPMSYIL